MHASGPPCRNPCFMHSRSPLQLFEDIAENISRIENYTRGYDAGKFSEDSMCQDAVQHCLLRLSEAARLLGDEAVLYAPAIPWRDIRGIGNRLRHEYQKVETALIWRIIEKDLSPLKRATSEALKALRG